MESDMDKVKCIGLALRTDDKNNRSMVQRKETVERTTTMVKFSFVKRISGSFQVYQKLLVRAIVEVGGGVTSRAP